jgi:glycosyltransferase involved in cell wall biosynthesis
MYDARLMARVDDQCCRHADLVIATSQDLLERCLQRNPHTVLVPHGVDYAHFARALDQPPRPADLPAGPVVGFFGLISEWMEQDLVARTAAALPSAHVVLIGTADVPVARLQGIPNLHLLGPRAFNILPDYVAHFTVGIIPFRVDDLTRAVNPIKLREMLSAGCPVVSTALPEVERYADGGPGVGVARDAARFVALVSERLASPLTAEQRRAISRRMAAETWEAKVGEILGWIAGRDAG